MSETKYDTEKAEAVAYVEREDERCGTTWRHRVVRIDEAGVIVFTTAEGDILRELCVPLPQATPDRMAKLFGDMVREYAAAGWKVDPWDLPDLLTQPCPF